jgi:hypothetical protein
VGYARIKPLKKEIYNQRYFTNKAPLKFNLYDQPKVYKKKPLYNLIKKPNYQMK